MLVAAGAVLLPLDALGVQALVLRGEVVAVLTVVASENDFVSWDVKSRVSGIVYRESESVSFPDPRLPIPSLQDLGNHTRTYGASTFSDREP